MDIKCKLCLEPWDMDTIHEIVAERYERELWHDSTGKYVQSAYDPLYNEVRDDFIKRGCAAFGGTCNEDGKDQVESDLWEAAYEFMGDDLDAVASIMEDMEL